MLRSIVVDKEKCTHCGFCLKDCVVGCIEFAEEKIPQYTSDGETTCIGCQHCMAICPTGALSFGGKQAKNASPIGFGKSEDVLQLIQSRRSVRFYKNENVPGETIDTLVKMLPFIPTGGNADNLHFSIVATKEKMDEIRNSTYEIIMTTENPSRFHTVAKNAFLEGKDVIYRGATAMIAVAIDKTKTIEGCETADPIIALSYFELYAQSMGLGTLWCDMAVTIAKQTADIYALLEIPNNYELYYIMLFGIPAVKYARTIQPEMFNIKILH